MNTEGYSIQNLVTDLRQVCRQFTDEREIVGAVRPLARDGPFDHRAFACGIFHAAVVGHARGG